MRLTKVPFTLAGEWIATLTAVCLIIAPTGCELADIIIGPIPGTTDNPFGFLINTETSGDTLGAVRLDDGRTAILYGTFNDDGTVRTVTGAAFRDQNGQTAGITFDDGRPKKGVGFDGSTIEFEYDEVSTQRLKGRVILTPADTGTPEIVDVDVDLEAAADQLAQLAADLASLTISEEEPPAGTAKTMVPSDDKRSGQEVGFVLGMTLTIVSIVLGYVMVAVMVQAMQAAMLAAAAASIAVTQAVIVAVFSPFILMGDVMRLSADQTSISVAFSGLRPGILFANPCCD